MNTSLGQEFPYAWVFLDYIAKYKLPHTTLHALVQYVLMKPSLKKLTHKDKYKHGARFVLQCDLKNFLDEYWRLQFASIKNPQIKNGKMKSSKKCKSVL